MSGVSHVLASSIFWAAAALCAVAQVAIVRSALRTRGGTVSAGSHARRSGPAAELLWVLLPAVMLAGTLLLTWRALEARSEAPASHGAARGTQHPAALIPESSL